MISRIVKLPKHNNVLIGRDLSNIFKAGHVYDIKKYGGEYVITDLGETALSEHAADYPNVNSSIEDIMCDKTVYMTKGEA